MFIGEIVAANARNYPNKIGIVDDSGTRLTWKEISNRVNGLSNALPKDISSEVLGNFVASGRAPSSFKHQRGTI